MVFRETFSLPDSFYQTGNSQVRIGLDVVRLPLTNARVIACAITRGMEESVASGSRRFAWEFMTYEKPQPPLIQNLAKLTHDAAREISNFTDYAAGMRIQPAVEVGIPNVLGGQSVPSGRNFEVVVPEKGIAGKWHMKGFANEEHPDLCVMTMTSRHPAFEPTFLQQFNDYSADALQPFHSMMYTLNQDTRRHILRTSLG